MNKKISSILQYIGFLGVGIFLVWWSIKDLDKADISQIKIALRNARYILVLPVFAILLLSHFLRALRWRLLIEPLGYTPGKRNTFFAVMIGYLANQAVPRLGEVLKCTFLSRYEKIPAEKLIGTIILERIVDALTLLLIFAITLSIQPDVYSELINTFFTQKTATEKNSISGLIILVIIAIIIAGFLFLWMYIKKKTINDVYALLKKLIANMWQGIISVKHLKKRTAFILLTFSIWLLYLAGGYIGFFALKETEMFGVKEAFSILSAGSVGMIATPGGIGAYALLIEKTMQLYGLQKGVALAFGWLLWFAQTSVILIGGFISLGLIPYFNKKIKNESSR